MNAYSKIEGVIKAVNLYDLIYLFGEFKVTVYILPLKSHTKAILGRKLMGP